MHDELIHTAGLIMTATTGTGLRTGKKLSSMYSAVQRCESINLTPEYTVLTVEMINYVLSLLETSEGFVQGVELRLTGILALKIVPHLTSSEKICNLSTDLKSDRLADNHLGHRVIGCHFSNHYSNTVRKAKAFKGSMIVLETTGTVEAVQMPSM